MVEGKGSPNRLCARLQFSSGTCVIHPPFTCTTIENTWPHAVRKMAETLLMCGTFSHARWARALSLYFSLFPSLPRLSVSLSLPTLSLSLSHTHTHTVWCVRVRDVQFWSRMGACSSTAPCVPPRVPVVSSLGGGGCGCSADVGD